ncbi:hypothetical protein, partial [Streptomyces sp. NPDC059071]|uniref:hypothetical protein n=1 Tax=unclassified Streptomyces TaxID=2593676 RepID=UPI003654E0F4
MRRHQPARTSAVAVITALGLTTGLISATATAAFADEPPAPAGLTIPAELAGDPNAAVLQQAGETGFLTGTMQAGFHWTSYADGTAKPVPLPAGYKTVYGTGGDIVNFVGDGRTVLQRDMRDGTERTITVPEGETLYNTFADVVITEKTDFSGRTTALYLQSWRDGRLTTRTFPAAGTSEVGIAGWDRDAIYLSKTYGSYTDDWRWTDVYRVDRDGNATLTKLADVSVEAGAEHVAQWHPDGRLTVWKKSDLSKPVHTLSVEGEGPGKLLGTVGDQVLIARPLPGSGSPTYASLRWRVVAVPFTGGEERTVLERATAMPDFLSDGTMLIGRADTGEGTGQGVYAIKPGGSDGTGTLAVSKIADAPAVPTATTRLALAQGRLSTIGRLPTLDGPEARLRTQDLAVTGTPEAGARKDRGADAKQFPGGCAPAADCPVPVATGDGRLVYRKKDGAGLAVVDAEGLLPGRTVTDLKVRNDAGAPLAVSGRYAAARTDDGRTRVFDLDTGANVRTGAVNQPFALSGGTLWTAASTASTDPSTVASAVDIRTGRSLGTAEVADCAVDSLQAAGTSLYWHCGNGKSGVYDTAATSSVPLPDHTSALLADGYVAWLKDGELRTTDLRGTAGTRVIGTPRGTAPGKDWTVDRFGGQVAYVDADEAVHVVPTGGDGSPLTSPDADTPTAVDAREGAWKPRWWLSEPAASWRLTLVHRATGTVARTLSGGETRGLIGAAWDGRDESGRPAVSGAYTWQLSAKPADGSGAELQLRGDVLLGGGALAEHGTYKPVTPARLMDTRSGLGVRKGKLGAGETVSLAVPQPGATAVVLNVTATSPTSSSFVSVYPYGTQRTAASNLNFTAGQTVPNLVVV